MYTIQNAYGEFVYYSRDIKDIKRFIKIHKSKGKELLMIYKCELVQVET